MTTASQPPTIAGKGVTMHWLRALSLVLLALTPLAAAAQDWPVKPVKMIVPYPPAGATDIAARVVAERLSKAFGQPFVVDNKPGAAGVIGMDLIAKSAPDGYTIGVVPDVISSAQHVYNLTFDPLQDLVPVVQLSQQPLVIAAHPSLNISTLAELVTLAKSKPGMGFATSGVGSQQHIAGEWFSKVAGIDIRHVPYKGGGQAINDVVAGQVPLAVLGSSPLLPHHRTGMLKLLAQTTPTRAPTLKDVPTVQEAGFKDFALDQWIGLFVPSGTPVAIIARLNAETNKALKDAALLGRFDQGALEAVGGSAADFAKLVKNDFEKYGRLIKELNIKIEQ